MRAATHDRERIRVAHDDRSVWKVGNRRRERMDALAALVEPLGVQHGVDRRCGRAYRQSRGPRGAKRFGSRAATGEARPMSRRQRDGLVEEEQLGPAVLAHDRAPAPAIC